MIRLLCLQRIIYDVDRWRKCQRAAHFFAIYLLSERFNGMKKRIFMFSAAAAILLTTLATGCSDKDKESARRQEIYQEIHSADKMVFASMAITKTVKTDRTDWYKIGKRIAVYSYDSYLRAYIDLSSLQMEDLEFDENNKTVKITLPPVMIETAGRDMEMRKEYENIGILRSDIDSRERAEMKEKANESFRKEVSENQEFRRRLTEAAERKAGRYFESLLAADGYTASIDFKK